MKFKSACLFGCTLVALGGCNFDSSKELNKVSDFQLYSSTYGLTASVCAAVAATTTEFSLQFDGVSSKSSCVSVTFSSPGTYQASATGIINGKSITKNISVTVSEDQNPFVERTPKKIDVNTETKDDKSLEQKRLEEEKKAAEEQKRLEEEKKAAEEQKRLEEEKKAAEEQKRLEEEKKAAEEQKRLEEEKKAAEEQKRLEEEKKAAEEQAQIENSQNGEANKDEPSVDEKIEGDNTAQSGEENKVEEVKPDSAEVKPEEAPVVESPKVEEVASAGEDTKTEVPTSVEDEKPADDGVIDMDALSW